MASGPGLSHPPSPTSVEKLWCLTVKHQSFSTLPESGQQVGYQITPPPTLMPPYVSATNTSAQTLQPMPRPAV